MVIEQDSTKGLDEAMAIEHDKDASVKGDCTATRREKMSVDVEDE